jgi:hypothetical protein
VPSYVRGHSDQEGRVTVPRRMLEGRVAGGATCKEGSSKSSSCESAAEVPAKLHRGFGAVSFSRSRFGGGEVMFASKHGVVLRCGFLSTQGLIVGTRGGALADTFGGAHLLWFDLVGTFVIKFCS